jgi:ABC-type uncharacterized transport system fused permease/ATPase subunit
LVDINFLKKLYKLIKISFPAIFGRESFALFTSYSLMIVRTLLTIYLAEINGSIVKAIIKMDFRHFIINVVTLALATLPSAVCNSGIEYANKMFACYMRENMSKYLHKNYLKEMCFYQVNKFI